MQKMADQGLTAEAVAAYPSPPNYASPHYDPKFSMSSSMSPGQLSKQPSQSPYGAPASGSGSGASGQDKSPLNSLNLGFLKTLTDKRATRGKFLLRYSR